MRASGPARSSPSLRAISAIDRSMIAVDIGNSIASAPSPNAPPVAPDAVAAALCQKLDAAPAYPAFMVPNATEREDSIALRDASLTTWPQRSGSKSNPRSMGVPTQVASRGGGAGWSGQFVGPPRALRFGRVFNLGRASARERGRLREIPA